MTSAGVLVRSCSALRLARALPTLSAFGSYGGSTRGYASVELPPEVLAAVTKQAELASAAAGCAAQAADVGGVLGATIGAIDAMQAASGLPWWATIAGVAVLVRTSMLPVTLKGMQASGALLPLLREARLELDAEQVVPTPAEASGSSTSPPPLQQQREQKQQQESQDITRGQAVRPAAAATAAAAAAGMQRPSTRQVLERFHRLRLQQGAPHPIWVLASPMLQLPVFIATMASIRTMSLTSWPGLSTGGLAWFTDLTLPAMDLTSLSAPMGSIGAVLPVAIVLSMFANIQAGFSTPPPAPGQPAPPPSVMLWAMDKLRLLLEWMLVPLFGVALQLPQGALCYWATSSTYALVQNHAFKSPAVRRALGLPISRRQPLPPPVDRGIAAEAEAGAAGGSAAVAGALVAANSGGGSGDGAAAGSRMSPQQAAADGAALRQFLSTTTDLQDLFYRAAELRSEGRVRAAIAVLQRLLELHPRQRRALFALGQLHAALKEWGASEQMYLASAEHEQDQHQRGRAWFGAGVALHMQDEPEAALEAFQKAADAVQADDLRVRAWVAQAAVYRKLGQEDAAVELLRRAAQLEPKVEEVYLKPLLKGEAPQPPTAA